MRYHGVDLHKGSVAVSIRDEVGHEVRYMARVETASYVATLGPQDSVALESGCGSFLWAERIQRRGAGCIVIDPYRFRIIRDSWHKTDRHDAGALSLGLWTSAQSGELLLPEVWQPTPEVRELRRLFSHWQLLNNQSRQLKAQVQSVLVENGISDRKLGMHLVDNPTAGQKLIATLELSAASLFMDLPRIRGHGVKQYLGGVGNDNGRREEEIHQGVQA
jgi:transposase